MAYLVSFPRKSTGRPLTVHSFQPWLGVAVLLCMVAARPAWGQENNSIFQRFDSGREIPKTWQTMIEVPVQVTPQTTPDAHINVDEGVNLVTAYRPENRAYFSRSFGYANVGWAPKNEIKTAQVVTLDMTEILNFRIAQTFVMSFGLGLGVMHGVVVKRDGTFQARFEPFVPVQFGVALPIGRSFMIGAKVEQSSFFGQGPTISMSRVLAGIGYNY